MKSTHSSDLRNDSSSRYISKHNWGMCESVSLTRAFTRTNVSPNEANIQNSLSRYVSKNMEYLGMAYDWTTPKRRFVNKMVRSTNILAFIRARLGIRLRLSDELCGVYMSEARNLKFEITAILFRFFVKVLLHLGFERGPHWKGYQKKKHRRWREFSFHLFKFLGQSGVTVSRKWLITFLH